MGDKSADLFVDFPNIKDIFSGFQKCGKCFWYVDTFINGIATVIVSKKWGYINKTGELLVTDASTTPDDTSFVLRLMNQTGAFRKDEQKVLEKGLKN